MRNTFGILFGLLFAISAQAADIQIIATVAITNGTVNGETITVNGDVRTATNSVVLPASQFLTNSSASGSAGSLFAHVALTPFSGITLGATATTNITLKPATNTIITVTVSSGWAVVSYSTNTVGVQVPVLVPLSGYVSPAQRTNVASAVAAMLNDSANTNPVTATAVSTSVKADATNAASSVSSLCIPMGAWFTNNVGDGASLTAATSLSVTNTGDGWAFADAVTNCIRSRFSLPWDWDASTVQVEIQALCTGTNSGPGGATNVVFAVRAASNALNNSAAQPTFGTAIWTTNHFGIGAYTNYVALTTSLTVGNTPAAGKSILWEIQRLGAQAGDTETNVSMCVTEVKVYYKRNVIPSFPTATP